jgi:nicotinamide-nucleotide amidase
MPGVPSEMVPMFCESVLPFVLRELASGAHVRMQTVHIFPAPESAVDERILDLTPLGRNPSVGITVRDGVVSVSTLARARDAREAERLVGQDVAALKERFGDLIFGFGNATLATAVSDELERHGLTIGVAESVTGGLVGHMLVDVPGISRFFLADIVAYSDQAKVKQLGVAPELIEEHGAVSLEVAESMARGVCAAVGCDLGLSTTGIAGPTGGSKQKPVGLVYIGVCLGGAAKVAELTLRGDRWQIKDRAAKHALNTARLALMKGMESLQPNLTL